ncbi:adenosylmethionine-8-amino-7-oxononanoate aminotransferase [Desulfovibrio sp. X2]|uniref:adenosylmethionine--8-amino-7-oxononanoate transaminase n=1 Tax=Desulfovibrio sp. X2 TaxID=941449 RepID=UPI000358CC20|nr:adenosylmethionine--8-amino-7-oxononanoate transaminase [Desulfovibrio sp. X2]EPR41691.1 adenosylmethionine-8-amino-7-oxononanoate aminotransferase [Desulfovibrio sp. X2]
MSSQPSEAPLSPFPPVPTEAADRARLAELDARHVWHPFTQAATAPTPVPIVSGKGARLYTADGRELLDLVSSWWVNLHGHCHPAVARAIAEQAGRLEHAIFADFSHAPGVRLAARLAAMLPAGLSRVFYSDNGSTAVEVALKMAHQFWRNQGKEKTVYVGFEGGYHGDTVGAMSAGRASGFFAAWERMLFPVEVAPVPATWDGDPDAESREAEALAALERILERNRGKVAAVVIEPLVQGAGGMRMCRPSFLAGLAERVRAADALLVFDEVMTGFGRTGANFACQKAGVTPDVICLSKGITAGFLPLSVTVASERIYEAFLGPDVATAFLHGHSYTANPLGCAAGLASMDLLEAPECRARITGIEAVHRERLPRLAALPGVIRPRLCGTIAAVDVTRPGAEAADYAAPAGPLMKKALLARGLLLRPLGNVLYLLPPYCVTDDELHRAYDAMEDVVRDLAAGRLA